MPHFSDNSPCREIYDGRRRASNVTAVRVLPENDRGRYVRSRIAVAIPTSFILCHRSTEH